MQYAPTDILFSYFLYMKNVHTTLEVVNVKCGGCAKTIISSLEKIGCTDISVSSDTQEITFTHAFASQKKEVIAILENLGYPEKNSEAATSLFKKAKSYASCAVGKFL